MLEFDLTEEQRALQRLARDFARNEIRPIAMAMDQGEVADNFPWDLIKKGSQLGLRTLTLPTEWGGVGADALSQLIVIDELAYEDVSCSKIFSQNWKIAPLLFVAGTDDQKQRYLPRYRDEDDFLLSFPVTEPNVGADVMGYYDAPAGEGIMTTAIRDGDHYVVNGVKQWGSHVDNASVWIPRVRTNPNVRASEGVSYLIVEKGTPGVRVGTVHDKIGWRAYHQAELFFDDARIPAANLLGGREAYLPPELGRYQAAGNIEVPAHLVALARAALDAGVNHANGRRQGGKNIIQHQAVAHSIAEMYTSLQAARSLIWRAAWMVSHGEEIDRNLLKANRVFCAETALKIALHSMDLFGGYGVIRGVPIEKLVRDAIGIQHGEGGHKVLNLSIGREIETRLNAGRPWIG